MPFGSVTLIPGVNVERTPTLLRAGVALSSLIRYRDSLVQKIGGWSALYPFAVHGIPRDLHAWQDLNSVGHLGIGTTLQLAVLTDGVLDDITPQTTTSNCVPNISTTAGSAVVSITDPNISNPTASDAVFFNVPISIGGLILDGLYQITLVTGTNSYQITAETAATTTCANPTATNGTTAIANSTLNFAATPAFVAANQMIWDITAAAAIAAGTLVVSKTGTTVVMSAGATAPGVGNGDNIVFAGLPLFATTSGDALVTVTLHQHGLSVGDTWVFPIPTTGNGITITGAYKVVSVLDADRVTIAAATTANATGSFAMNGGRAQLVYHIALNPIVPGTGYGLGNYGAGNYGYGTGSGSTLTGDPITADDWSLDNWGQILIACPRGGPIYYYDQTSGQLNAAVVSTGPPYNSGAFVSTSQQILVAWGSSVKRNIGYQQDPLLVQWCDVSNFFNWTASRVTQAGNFVIPIGSQIMAGAAVSNQNLIWTDLDLWAMNYVGRPNVYGFNKVGAGMGAASAHSTQQLRGGVYWMGSGNFFSYDGGGPRIIPCPVWDAVFQNINTDHLANIRAMPNTPFNEVGWFYPSASSLDGECDSYVKMNIAEPGAPWDIGPMQRSAWIDKSVLGDPIATDSQGYIYQHEVSPDAAGAPLISTFTTGYFYLAEGEEFVFVDQVIPDFKWATFIGAGSAQMQFIFNVVDWPGDTPRQYGPYTVTRETKYISVRFRGRLMSVTIQSADLGSFWRIGSIKYRFAPAGRR